MFIGDRLKQIREEKNLTQTQLGKIFNISASAINRYEKGQREPDVDLLVKYANFFDISVDWIIERTALRNPYKKIPDIEHSYRIQEAEHLFNVDPELFSVMCSLKDLPEFERQKIIEYSSFLLGKYPNRPFI